jgi:hypothetical protein
MRRAVLAATTVAALACAPAAGASAPPQPVTNADVQSFIANGAVGFAPGGKVVSAATVAAAVAAAQNPPQSASYGARRAARAGVRISRAARRIMENAPLGSCLNDPIQAKCGPRPKAIVASKRERAHIAQEDQCEIIAYTPNRPNPPGDRAYGSGANECSPAVSEQELIVQLYMYFLDSSSWQVVAQGSNVGPGGTEIQVTVDAFCQYYGSDSDLRAFHTKASGYADIDGVWYAGEQDKYTNLKCVVA